jgi:Rrf2 family protein
MLCISKKTEYSLVALGHMAENPDQIASAREMALKYALPQAMLMNILKTLQNHGLLRSTRGVKGGYRIDRDLSTVSLYELIAMVDCSGHSADGDCGCLEHVQGFASELDLARMIDSHGPVQALQFTLVRFLKRVRVADLVLPGRRIDVPIEQLKFREVSKPKDRSLSHADYTE